MKCEAHLLETLRNLNKYIAGAIYPIFKHVILMTTILKNPCFLYHASRYVVMIHVYSQERAVLRHCIISFRSLVINVIAMSYDRTDLKMASLRQFIVTPTKRRYNPSYVSTS